MRLHALFLVVLLSSTCNPSALQVQARLANSVAIAGNRVLPLLIDVYRADGLRIIEHARATGLPRFDAERRLQEHVHEWQAVWGECDDGTGMCDGGAWPSLRAAHDAWASSLERQIEGQPLDLAATTRHASELRTAYCHLRASVPTTHRESIPQLPGVPCP